MALDLLIVGIDPGTTTGYAVVDLEGRVIAIGSSKHLGLSNMIGVLYQYGLPCVVGTDKGKVPSFVDQFAKKTGSKLISNEKDLSVSEKNDLVRGLEGLGPRNTHEKDALASALYAYKSLRNLLNKIKKSILENNLKNEVKEFTMLVLKEGYSIREALVAVTLIEEKKLVEKSIREERFLEKDFKGMLSSLECCRNDIFLLKEELSTKNKEIAVLHRKVKGGDKIKKRVRKKIDSLFLFKDQRILNLLKELEAEKRKGQQTQKKLLRAIQLIKDFDRFFYAYKGKNLTKKWLDIIFQSLGRRGNNFIYVDDCNTIDKEEFEKFSMRIAAVISLDKPKQRSVSGVLFIHESEVLGEHIGDLYVFCQDKITPMLHNRQYLKDIVGEYQNRKIKDP